MNEFKKTVFTGFLSVLIFGVIYFTYFLTHQAEFAKQNQLNILLSGQKSSAVLGLDIKSSGCVVRGSLPDQDCTPGAVFSDATVEEICVSGYTKTVRNVPVSLKREVYREYDFAYPPPYGSFEADHLIPLALGGSNDIANLWPEAADPRPGFKEKDVVENYLHEEVCGRRINLGVAQEMIAKNWLLIYENLSPRTIAQIKSRYKSWAN